MTNLNHLRLFYYTVKCGGMETAAEKLNLEASGVRKQVSALEDAVGSPLFLRKPHKLTPAGEKLHAHIKEFFEGLEPTVEEIRGEISKLVRIGASEIILREHLPAVLLALRREYPEMRTTLRQGYQPQLEEWLNNQELDLAITLREGVRAEGAIWKQLLEPLPLVLLVKNDSKLKSTEDLWAQTPIAERLICLPEEEAISKSFQKGLRSKQKEWLPSIEVGTLDLVETYVATGNGIGLSVNFPLARRSCQINILPLPDPPFQPVSLGILWQGTKTPILQSLIKKIEKAAKDLQNDNSVPIDTQEDDSFRGEAIRQVSS